VNVLSLFSGIGGLDLGLERAGMTVVGQVEIDPWCRRVLAKHWPEVPRHDDVRTCVQWWAGESRPPVHLVAGGFPCQPVSQAGRQAAKDDPRWLWPLMAATVAVLRPAWIVIENVSGLLKLGLADIYADLGRFGYRARAGWITACGVGAPHARKRLFVLAHTYGEPAGHGHDGTCPVLPPRPQADEGIRRALPDTDHWATEPRVDRLAYGVPRQLDRLRGLGNAVVPQVAEHIGRMIMAVAS
jgi:DNA (cytosine-5)-methyltransferase 1